MYLRRYRRRHGEGGRAGPAFRPGVVHIHAFALPPPQPKDLVVHVRSCALKCQTGSSAFDKQVRRALALSLSRDRSVVVAPSVGPLTTFHSTPRDCFSRTFLGALCRPIAGEGRRDGLLREHRELRADADHIRKRQGEERTVFVAQGTQARPNATPTQGFPVERWLSRLGQHAHRGPQASWFFAAGWRWFFAQRKTLLVVHTTMICTPRKSLPTTCF